MTTAYLIGAGASAGTLGSDCAPPCAFFGKVLKAAFPNWQLRYADLHWCIERLSAALPSTSHADWALDKVWGAIDNGLKDMIRVAGSGMPLGSDQNQVADILVRAGFDLKKAVANIYGDRLAAKIQASLNRDTTIKKEFRHIRSGDGVISMNYDLLAETTLRALGIEFYLPSVRGVKRDVSFSKPHGSLAWKRQLLSHSDPIEILDVALREDQIHLQDYRGPEVQPAIIGPVPFKDEILSKETSHEEFSRLVWLQLRMARDLIAEADALVVLGYGLPPEDGHLQVILERAAAQRSEWQKDPLVVRVFELNTQRFADVEMRLQRAFRSPGVECHYEGAVIGGI